MSHVNVTDRFERSRRAETVDETIPTGRPQDHRGVLAGGELAGSSAAIHTTARERDVKEPLPEALHAVKCDSA